MKKYILFLFLFLAACSTSTYNPSKNLYQFRGILPVVVPHIKREIKPIDMTKENLTIEAYNKISVGIGIVVGSFLIGLFFSNPFVNSIANFGVPAGGTWAGIGIIKLFVAAYLTWVLWICAIGILGALIYRYRKKSIIRCGEWIKKEIKNDKTLKEEC